VLNATALVAAIATAEHSAAAGIFRLGSGWSRVRPPPAATRREGIDVGEQQYVLTAYGVQSGRVD